MYRFIVVLGVVSAAAAGSHYPKFNQHFGGPQLGDIELQPQFDVPQFSPQFQPQLPPQLLGGEDINKDFFERAQKAQNDLQFESLNGQTGEQFQQAANALRQAQAAARNLQSDSGLFSNENARRGLAENGRQFAGGQRRTQEGKYLQL